MLTGRAKKDFNTWLNKQLIMLPEGFNSLSDKFKQVLIIEWLDDNDINIIPAKAICNTYPWQYIINDDLYCGIPNRFETRIEAINKGIMVANNIYNLKEALMK